MLVDTKDLLKAIDEVRQRTPVISEDNRILDILCLVVTLAHLYNVEEPK